MTMVVATQPSGIGRAPCAASPVSLPQTSSGVFGAVAWARDALMYQARRLEVDGGRGELLWCYVGFMAPREKYHAWYRGPSVERVDALKALVRYGGPAATRDEFSANVQYLLLGQSTNPVLLRATLAWMDRLIGPQPDAPTALREIRRCMLNAHPDKTAHLPMESRYSRLIVDSLYESLETARALARDETMGPRLFAARTQVLPNYRAVAVLVGIWAGFGAIVVWGAVSFCLVARALLGV